MRFKKGHKNWNVGIKIDFEKYPNYGMKGKKHNEETKIRIKNNQKDERYLLLNKGVFKKGHKVFGEGMQKAIETNKKEGVWNKGLKVDRKKYPSMGHFTKHKKETIEKYKEKRKNWKSQVRDTSIEVKIQNFLKELKIGYFTHYYCDEILNSYQCDIFIPVQKNRDKFIRQPIIIECDGDYWHSYPVGREIDRIRTSELLEKGFKVLRIWERDIKVMDIDEFNLVINGGNRF